MKVLLKPLNTVVLWWSEGFQGAVNWETIYVCSFSSLDTQHLLAEKLSNNFFSSYSNNNDTIHSDHFTVNRCQNELHSKFIASKKCESQENLSIPCDNTTIIQFPLR